MHGRHSATRIPAVLVALLIAVPSPAATATDGGPSTIAARLGSAPYLPAAPEVLELLASSSTKACRELARGITLLEQGQLEEARAAIATARELEPQCPYPLYYLGEAALRGGDLTGAIDLLRSSLGLRRDFAGAYALLGTAHLAGGESDKGLVCYRMAIALAPGLARGHLDLGRAELQVGQPELAKIEFERVLELDPGCLEARYLLARALINAGDSAAGFAALEAYLRDAESVTAESERVIRAKEILGRFSASD